MSEMVERVANAMARGEGDHVMGFWRDCASLAIEAMREPAEAMIVAGYVDENAYHEIPPQQVWTAMIDAALETPQQQADELLADYQEQRNIDRVTEAIDRVTEAIVRADQEVRFYQQTIISDPRMIKVWHDIEVCRDVLSRLLDTAEGKLK